MPRGDGTGPMGQGPMSGRGSGFCILRIGDADWDKISGFAGIEGRRVEVTNNNASVYASPSPKATDGQGKATADKKEVSQMPRGDGTGPMGMGPMTGRAAGYCAGYPVPGYMNPGLGRGFGRGFWGRGRGGGWGRRNWFYATGVPGWARAGPGLPAWGGYPPYGTSPQAVQAGGQAAPTPEQELDVLQGQAEYFTGALEDIKKRIGEIEAEKKNQ